MYSFTTQRFNRTGTKRSKKVTKSSSTLSRGKKATSNRRGEGLASSTLITGQPDIVPGMSVTVICAAIQGRNQISFQYSLGSDPGPRLVEPYMVAYNRAGHLALSAWFLDGNSESQERQSWRKYLLSGISNVTILRQQFATPRPGYNPSGGR